MKKWLLPLLSPFCLWAQVESEQSETKDYGRAYGGVESNVQWYQNDKGRMIEQPEDPIRSNNYIFVNYQIKRFTFGIQVEAYEKNAVLNFNPGFKGTDLATYFANYRGDKIDLTAGYFYEQFGSGLLLRAWEDRALGINTALFGGRIKYEPSQAVRFSVLSGRQRSGFSLAEGQIYGADSQFDLSPLFKTENDFQIGFSYVGRYQALRDGISHIDPMTHAFGSRFQWSNAHFYASGEYNFKSKDGIIDIQNTLLPDLARTGTAVLLNFGYTKEGLGIDATFRRMENFSFLSEREPTVFGNDTSLSFNDKIINFTPALTKQHHSNLANIYVYMAQNRVDFIDPTIMKAGETGGQIDLFYDIAKGTALGGKYGTKVAINLASWYNLPGSFRLTPPDFQTRFFGVGTRYFSDYNIEIKKKLDEQWRTSFVYINQFYNKRWLEGGSEVNTHIVTTEVVYNFNAESSIRFEAEHMWADADFKNWAGGTIELNLKDKYSFYVWDIVNYGNDNPLRRSHYYNFGGAYRTGSYRVGLNYGRQRGGLVCVGGVCRFVPESTGFTLTFSRSF